MPTQRGPELGGGGDPKQVTTIYPWGSDPHILLVIAWMAHCLLKLTLSKYGLVTLLLPAAPRLLYPAPHTPKTS